MKFSDIKEAFGVGKITAQNTTVDVKPGETQRQARKYGFKLDKKGKPPTLKKKTRGSATNVLYNLGQVKEDVSSCPRTRAHLCQCESLSQVTEGSETAVIAQSTLEHSDTVEGLILLIQDPAGGPTLIKGTIRGLEPGEHGFHIHEYGDLSQGCESAGGHYNPDGVDHGDLENGHVGDLGNITANEDGVAEFTIKAERVDLVGERSVVGRAIVVHADVDDLGKGGDAESRKTGNAGDRLACGVIVLRNEKVEETYTRSQLPQIKNENLKKIRHTMEWAKIQDLIPVQEERIIENFKRQVDRIVAGKYNPIIVDCDNKIVNGHHRYEAARLLGYDEVAVAKLPWTVATIVENFADGKKKGKSRPGRVKRAGASCKGSVTSLRKKAAKYSGEKGKMYHWCANMKGGKKK